MTSKIR
ncbi:Protein of unknown function [Lactobacillus helveticus CIRM-BIA 101]|nr:Protein of unknown function [Lactobacillus helveticus CIRM-BIA 101]